MDSDAEARGEPTEGQAWVYYIIEERTGTTATLQLEPLGYPMSFYEVYVELPEDEMLLVNSDVFGLGEWRNWLDDLPPKGTMGYFDKKAVKGAALREQLEERLGKGGKGDRITHLNAKKYHDPLTKEEAFAYLEPEAEYVTSIIEV